MESSPEPTGPVLDLNNRATPEGEQRHADDMLGILRRETESPQINSAGVITATNIASRCWKAANRVAVAAGDLRGGRLPRWLVYAQPVAHFLGLAVLTDITSNPKVAKRNFIGL